MRAALRILIAAEAKFRPLPPAATKLLALCTPPLKQHNATLSAPMAPSVMAMSLLTSWKPTFGLDTKGPISPLRPTPAGTGISNA